MAFAAPADDLYATHDTSDLYSSTDHYLPQSQAHAHTQHTQHPQYQHQQYSAPADPPVASFYSASMANGISCDIKPRLTKEQHDILESHYQNDRKPNTVTKKTFAESLHVSLEKVNNWFQNRRAKTKQDAKKQAGALNLNLYQQHGSSSNFSSDCDSSPSFLSSDYMALMQQYNADDRSNMFGPGMQPPQLHDQQSIHGLPYASLGQQFGHGSMPQHASQDMFDSPQEMNRRTLTQEQFDAFSMSHSNGQFTNFQPGATGDSDLQQVFSEMSQDDFKTQHAYAFPHPMSAPLSSNDSSIPSSISEQFSFPSSAIMQHHQNLSTESLDWVDSRSSSVSMPSSQDDIFQQMQPPPQQDSAARSTQWQPGQSVPVDPSALQQQFSEVEYQKLQVQQQQVQPENPMTWPVDDNFVRRDSQTGSLLAQEMSSFAIQTPQAPQTATFKCPPPPLVKAGSIAARRQRPRPATLGIDAMRSQSYNGAVQPASPSQQSNSLAPAQPQLRRIRSSINSGRVTKSGTGSAQRSPLNFAFAEGLHSPKLARQVSSTSLDHLVPPSPLSPNEMSHPDAIRAPFPPWQSSSGPITRQASISETDFEHNMPTLPQTFTSPPHTPMYQHLQHQQHPFQSRIGNNVITENTPPQSAPASQQTFPHSTFMALQHQPQNMGQAQHQPQFQAYTPPRSLPFNEQQLPMTTAGFVPQRSDVAPVDPSSMVPVQFPNGVPLVDEQGAIRMGFPPQMQQHQQQLQFVHHGLPQSQYQSPPRHITAPPEGGQYSFVTSDGTSPGMRVTSQAQKQPPSTSELFVHEYSPPDDVKGVPGSRKAPVDNGPKSYTFANHGPEHFLEKEKAKKSVSSGSPASATS